MKIYYFTKAEPSGGTYVQDGDLVELSWGFTSDSAYMIETYPEKFSGFQSHRKLMRQKTIFGERISRGDYIPDPIDIGWNVINDTVAGFLYSAYRKRVLMILEDDAGNTTIARIVDLKLTPLKGYDDYWKCDAKFYPAAVFKVYRSLDYGNTYQLASSELSVNHFEDTGFVWNGRLKYRIEYSQPQAPFIPNVDPENGVFISSVDDWGTITQDILPLGIEGSYNPWDLPILENGSIMLIKKLDQYFITPPSPNVSQTSGLILVNGDYVVGVQFNWTVDYSPQDTYPILAITSYKVKHDGTIKYNGTGTKYSTDLVAGEIFEFLAVNHFGEGQSTFVTVQAPLGLMSASKDTVSMQGECVFVREKNQYYVSKTSENDSGELSNGSLNFTHQQSQYYILKTLKDDSGALKNGSLSFAYEFEGENVIYL